VPCQALNIWLRRNNAILTQPCAGVLLGWNDEKGEFVILIGVSAAVAATILLGGQAAPAAEILDHKLPAPQRGAFAGAPGKPAGSAMGGGVELGVTSLGKVEFAAAGPTLDLGRSEAQASIGK
jgi:hypothetical protein